MKAINDGRIYPQPGAVVAMRVRRNMKAVAIGGFCCVAASIAAAGQAVTRAQLINTVLSSGAGSVGTTQLNMPYGVALDGAGNLYVADGSNDVVRKVTPSGVSTIVAGTLTVACAGGKNTCGDGGQATSAQLSVPVNVALDAQGDLYIADRADNRIRMVNTAGVITTIAGNGLTCTTNTTATPCGDTANATLAQLGLPSGVAVDQAGNVYIADVGDNRIRKVAVGTNIITTVAGSGTAGYDQDNVLATAAELNAPYAVAVDLLGNIYISDRANNRIRKVAASTGIITTIAGTGAASYDMDNQLATKAAISGPFGVGTDSFGNVYVSDTGNSRIREVNITTGIITTVAGNGKTCTVALDALPVAPCGDGGLATSAILRTPYGTVVDPEGNLYIADRANERVRVVNTSVGSVPFPATAIGSSSTAVAIPLLINTAGTTINSITVAASQGGSQEYSISDPALPSNAAAGTVYSFTVTFTPSYPGVRSVPLQVNTSAGNFVIGLSGIGVGPQVALTSGTISTLAGTGTAGYSGDQGSANSAKLNGPSKEATDSAGNLYIADTANNVIREVSALGTITTIAGTGTAGYTGDSAVATAAQLNHPAGVAIDSAGDLFIADTGNNVIREVLPSGVIVTAAGTGSSGYTGDNGAGFNATLNAPSGLAVDSFGNLYIADAGNNVVRELSVLGTMTTIAGNGTSGYSGDNGSAIVAQLKAPNGVSVDNAGNVIIADIGNSVVREVNLLGIVKTVAGSGTAGYSGDNGPATSAQLNGPSGVTVDSGGDIYIAEAVGARVRRVSSAGTITTVAGNGAAGDSGDSGPATAAQFSNPSDVALDSLGNLFVADTNNQSIRTVNELASTLTFNNSTVGVPSTDSPQAELIMNIGNAALMFTAPPTGQNPNSSNTSFSVANTSSCPILASTSAPVALATGNSCTLQLNFTPTVAGPLNGTFSITDNALNATGSTQVVNVRNVAFATLPVNTTTTVVVTTPNYGKTQVTATIAPVSGTLVPSGTVVFSIDTVAQPAVNVGGTGSASLPASIAQAISAGSHTISAAYTSNSSKLAGSMGSTTTNISVASTTLTVNASLSVVGLGSSIALTATANTLVPESPMGQVTFFSNNVPVGNANLVGGVATLNTTALPAGTDLITAMYAGDGNFTGSTTTSSVTVTVIVPGFTLTASPAILMVSAGGSGTSIVTLSAVNTFGGTVTFTATGLSPGGSASFSPATVIVPTNGTVTTTVTVTAGKSQAQLYRHGAPSQEGSSIRYVLLLFPVLMLSRKKLRKHASLSSWMVLLGVLSLLPVMAGLMGCGNNEQPPVNYNVQVIGTSGSLQQSTTILLTVE
jgi:hypothetical protein